MTLFTESGESQPSGAYMLARLSQGFQYRLRPLAPFGKTIRFDRYPRFRSRLSEHNSRETLTIRSGARVYISPTWRLECTPFS